MKIKDQGFNYSSERFSHRITNITDVFKAFNSEEHGDPSTPLFMAYPGDPVTIRFVYPADRARAHTFAIHGHKFLRSQDDVNSSIISAKGFNTVGFNDDFYLIDGAGGYLQQPGDYSIGQVISGGISNWVCGESLGFLKKKMNIWQLL